MRSHIVLIAIALITQPLCADVHVWTGAATDRFSDPANWTGGSPAGDPAADLSFPAGSRLAVLNDITGLSVRSIAISGSGYNITGTAINLANADIMDSAAGANAIAVDLVLSGGLAIDVAGSPGLKLSGAITGAGNVRKTGPGRLAFGGSNPNTYLGTTSVTNGELRLNKSARVPAVPGDLIVGTTGVQNEYGHVLTYAEEQIADFARITIQPGSFLRIGGVETLGAITLYRGGGLVTFTPVEQPSSVGRAIFAGDINIAGEPSYIFTQASIQGDIWLQSTRNVTIAPSSYGAYIANVQSASNAGLSIDGPVTILDDSYATANITGSYGGPTRVNGGSVTLQNLASAVTITNGRFQGTAASLFAEGGDVNGRTHAGGVTLNSLQLSSNATVTIDFHDGLDSTRIRLNGALNLGNATLFLPDYPRPLRLLGQVYRIIANESAQPTVGTFAGLPEGAIIEDRFRISYVGGDGNDITLTEVGQYASTITVTSPLFGTEDVPLTLQARISVESHTTPATGTVTFAEGQTILAVVPTTDNMASATMTLPLGSHQITVSYSGDFQTKPAQVNQTVKVQPPVPIVSSIEPSVVDGGVITTLIIRGSNFKSGATIVINSALPATFISPSELHFDYEAPVYTEDVSVDLRVQQPGEGVVVSARASFTVRGNPPSAPEIVFESQAAVANVTTGTTTAWLYWGSRPAGNGAIMYESGSNLIADTDSDGVVRWDFPQTIAPYGFWTAVDMTSRRIQATQRRNGDSRPHPLAFPRKMFVRDPAQNFSHIVFAKPFGPIYYFLWVRPGAGAWQKEIIDGTDLDGSQNYTIVFDTSMMQPVSGSPTPPAGVEAGDIFLGLDRSFFSWFGDTVDSHLSEADGSGVVGFTSPTLPHTPEGGVATITLLRRDGSDGTVTVSYTTQDFTAVGGVHFQPRSGTITFEPGEILKTVEIPILNDTVYSGPTQFHFVLSDPTGTFIAGPTSVIVNIDENDPLPVLSIHPSISEVPEGDSGTFEIPIDIVLQGSALQPVTARWSWRESPYGPYTDGELVSFGPRETVKTVSIKYTGDTIPEPDVSLVINVGADNAISAGTATTKIIDDDFATISISDVSIGEGDGVARVTLVASQETRKAVVITYSTLDRSATAGSDYASTSGTITFGPGFTRATISIPVVDDLLAESPESFAVALTNITGGRLGRSSAIVQIVDNDVESPAGPTGLAAIATGPTTVSLTWLSVAGAIQYEIIRSSGGSPYAPTGSSGSTWFTDLNAAPNTTVLYKVRAIFSGGSPSPYSVPDVATTVTFTDDPLLAGVTPIKALHFHDLRTAVNAMRAAAALPPFDFDDALAAGGLVRSTHLTQLRTALNQARATLGLTPVNYRLPSIISGQTSIAAAHVQEIRAGCQ